MKTALLQMRIAEEDKKALAAIAEVKGQSLTTFVMRAVKAAIAQELQAQANDQEIAA